MGDPVKPDFQILYSENQIRKRIQELAAEISKDYRKHPIQVIALLNGSFMFLADLVRQLHKQGIALTLDFMKISSYGADTVSSGKPVILQKLGSSVENRHVLVIDDILDTGNTLKFVCAQLREMNPASLKTCVLLDKPSRRQTGLHADYAGFKVENIFVVGYGLDFNDRYRELPFIAALKEKK